MSDSTEVPKLPSCDLCKEAGIDTPAMFDAKMRRGPWANLCLDHFTQYGMGLGTGLGQRLIPPEDRRVPKANTITTKKGKIIVIPTEQEMEEAVYEGLWHPGCPYCGGSGSAEPDADTCVCKDCGKTINIRPIC